MVCQIVFYSTAVRFVNISLSLFYLSPFFSNLIYFIVDNNNNQSSKNYASFMLQG